jgi:tRNA (cytidine/uridine-2'-O-)-methyltransferase
MKLRAPPLAQPFDIVLVEPEIPPNTGNIARLCAATTSRLHLVGKLGFRTDEKSIRRAGLDYWHLVEVRRHDDLARYFAARGDERAWFFTANVGRSYLEVDYRPGDALVFGRESVGLPREVIERHADRAAAIPTIGGVRSLNLANAVAVVVYEALRSTGALGGPRLS